MVLKDGALDFPSGPVIKNPPASVGDKGSVPALGRSQMPEGNQAHVPQLPSRCIGTMQHNKRRQHNQKAGPHS